jgi:putative oxidoreductase
MTATALPPRSRLRALTVILWIVSVLLGVAMAGAGSGKFRGDFWQTKFVGWGYPVSFSFVIGALELLGGLCLLVPRLASYAAILLAAILTGATVTLVTHPTPKWSPVSPAVYVVVFAIVAIARWKDRMRLGSP